MKVSEVFVDTLAEAGVKRVYGVTGDSLNGITDAIRRNKKIEWMHVRHEEAAAFAAGAESQLTGRDCGMCGKLRPGQSAPDQRPLRLPSQPRPGAGHRRPDSQPGNRQRLLPGNRSPASVSGLQSLLRNGLAGGSDAPRAGDRDAHRDCPAGSGRGRDPGRRVCSASVPTPPLALGIHQSASVVCPSIEELRQAADILNRAQKVTILGGAGCEGAHDELVALAAKLKAPIVHAHARQGVHRVRQSLRRRHDRPAGLFLRLPRHDELRRAAHAGHRLSLSAVLSQEGEDPSGRRPRGADRPPHPGRPGPDRQRQGHARGAHRRCSRTSRTASISISAWRTTRERAKGWTIWPSASPAARRSTPSTSPRLWTSWPPTMPSSPAMWARPPSGLPAICT